MLIFSPVLLAPPPPSHQQMRAQQQQQQQNGGGPSNSTGTSSPSSSNNGSPIKEIPSIGSTNNRVSHSMSVPLNLFNAMQKDQTPLPTKAELDISRYTKNPWLKSVPTSRNKCSHVCGMFESSECGIFFIIWRQFVIFSVTLCHFFCLKCENYHLSTIHNGLASFDRGSVPFFKVVTECRSFIDFRSSMIPPPTIRRLMAAVSFGYGLFHLAVSLLPPKLLNVIHLLGFEGDRQTGIQALHFSRQGSDMRGPLAT